MIWLKNVLEWDVRENIFLFSMISFKKLVSQIYSWKYNRIIIFLFIEITKARNLKCIKQKKNASSRQQHTTANEIKSLRWYFMCFRRTVAQTKFSDTLHGEDKRR